mmetsp:Transcript_991/g.2372  ORF Transcript_991/g.2372 Transcript_991/m.2372 type:complete len:229 (-) Transcript_991:136-822(-)
MMITGTKAALQKDRPDSSVAKSRSYYGEIHRVAAKFNVEIQQLEKLKAENDWAVLKEAMASSLQKMAQNFSDLAASVSAEKTAQGYRLIAESCQQTVDDLAGPLAAWAAAKAQIKKLQQLRDDAVKAVPNPGVGGAHARDLLDGTGECFPPAMYSAIKSLFPHGGPPDSAIRSAAQILESHWVYSEDDLCYFTVQDLDAMGLPMLLSRKLVSQPLGSSAKVPMGARRQ